MWFGNWYKSTIFPWSGLVPATISSSKESGDHDGEVRSVSAIPGTLSDFSVILFCQLQAIDKIILILFNL